MSEGSDFSMSQVEVGTEVTEGEKHICYTYLFFSIEMKSQSILMFSQEKIKSFGMISSFPHHNL